MILLLDLQLCFMKHNSVSGVTIVISIIRLFMQRNLQFFVEESMLRILTYKIPKAHVQLYNFMQQDGRWLSRQLT